MVPNLSTASPKWWGWDLAKKQDYTVGIGLDASGYVCRFERLQGIPWDKIIDHIILATNGAPALVDSTGLGDPVVDLLRKKATSFEGYHFTPGSKQKLMEGLSVAIQSQTIHFPPGIITQELEQYEYVYTRTGCRYSAPEGYNDDAVCALALAQMHRTTNAPPIQITQSMIAEVMASGAMRRRR